MNATMLRMAREAGCKGCLAYAPHGSGEQAGQCRAGLPRTSNGQRWPVVSPSDWCSEWLPNEEKVEVRVHATLGGPPVDEID